MKLYMVLMVILVGVSAENLFEDGVYKDALWFVKECGSKKLTLCFKEKALKFIERLPNNIDIGTGIRIVQSDSGRVSREYAPVALPEGVEEREEAIDQVLMDKIAEYLNTHILELKLPMILGLNKEDPSEARRKQTLSGHGGFSGGYKKGKKGKKGGMGGMMMLLSMKFATLFALGLKAVAALAFKALLVGKIALTLASIIALKKLTESKGSSTYEVITHNAGHFDDHHDRIYSPGDLMYKGHRVGS